MYDIANSITAQSKIRENNQITELWREREIVKKMLLVSKWDEKRRE